MSSVVDLSTAALVLVMLTSCVSLDLFGGEKVDRSLSTASVPNQQNTQTVSDDATIRNAVTSADLAKISDSPLPWANAATGSAGVVTAIREDRSTGFVCRNFNTTRHSFEGIASYSGQACLSETGEWLMTSFSQK
ncbi:RT0821/Lpp0805 family surface protein [Agrobacterium sp. rho-13.3]|uniref:RT0821/Lpp0805 family surface protein n=1 Tax=Agrobacterium sp. rho-13.3 TaxID=3072980 RepID=UPI002A0FE8BF|nr:RT0821/Lpp0805 family surface protein [Agrobacterium sp. rho-13.3]MDX8308578.1 RT0821/Lpp0805 family surface protein [Agrobacterium sp. rho-13.3]